MSQLALLLSSYIPKTLSARNSKFATTIIQIKKIMIAEEQNGASRDDICYHHFTLTFNPNEVASRFKNVRFVLVAGCSRRVESHAKYLVEHLFNCSNPEEKVQLLTRECSRFCLYKVGPVLLASHGMGSASVSIALHELFLMCQQAQTIDKITLLRFGTCGGIGVVPGTVCITNRALDPMLNEFVELKICLKLVRRSTKVDRELADSIRAAAVEDESRPNDMGGEFEITTGATIGTDDFYEEAGRTNGAICEHSQQDERIFLARAHEEMGVINMEMESCRLAAMCNKLAVPFGVVCVAVNNRLAEGGLCFRLSQQQTAQFERRLFWACTQFVRRQLQASDE